MSLKSKLEMRRRRHLSLRKKISGTPEAPRMSVCFTAKNMYVQFVDDTRSHTLAAVSTLDKVFRETKMKANLAGATALGKLAAERAIANQIKRVVFDRGGFKYHGRVKAVADAARASGLQF